MIPSQPRKTLLSVLVEDNTSVPQYPFLSQADQK